MKVVFDTNVLMAAFITEGLCSRLMLRANRGDFDLYASSSIIQEFEEALKMKAGFSRQEIRALISLVGEIVLFTEPGENHKKKAHGICRDKTDDHVLACALACNADYLVTGDKDLLEIKRLHHVLVVSPRDFELLFG